MLVTPLGLVTEDLTFSQVSGVTQAGGSCSWKACCPNRDHVSERVNMVLDILWVFPRTQESFKLMEVYSWVVC